MVVILPTRDGHRGQPIRNHNDADRYTGRRACGDHGRVEKVVGCLLGRTSLGLLTVERFFLPEVLRRNQLGSQILAMAEEEARRRGCTRGVLSTLHFADVAPRLTALRRVKDQPRTMRNGR